VTTRISPPGGRGRRGEMARSLSEPIGKLNWKRIIFGSPMNLFPLGRSEKEKRDNNGQVVRTTLGKGRKLYLRF
jgi:hypothetical protein